MAPLVVWTTVTTIGGSPLHRDRARPRLPLHADLRENRRSAEHYGEHRLFRVAFAGKDRVAVLEAFLAAVAAEIGERSVDLETVRIPG